MNDAATAVSAANCSFSGSLPAGSKRLAELELNGETARHKTALFVKEEELRREREKTEAAQAALRQAEERGSREHTSHPAGMQISENLFRPPSPQNKLNHDVGYQKGLLQAERDQAARAKAAAAARREAEQKAKTAGQNHGQGGASPGKGTNTDGGQRGKGPGKGNGQAAA